jgi:hypothetical protein
MSPRPKGCRAGGGQPARREPRLRRLVAAPAAAVGVDPTALVKKRGRGRSGALRAAVAASAGINPAARVRNRGRGRGGALRAATASAAWIDEAALFRPEGGEQAPEPRQQRGRGGANFGRRAWRRGGGPGEEESGGEQQGGANSAGPSHRNSLRDSHGAVTLGRAGVSPLEYGARRVKNLTCGHNFRRAFHEEGRPRA